MKFSGRLQVEADSRTWLKADLALERGRVELTSGGDVLGHWATSQVTAERVEGDRFSLHLGEETAMFIADDALGFSYEALPQLNKRQLIPVTGMVGKIKSGLRVDDARRSEEPVAVPPPTPASPVSAASLTGRRLRELLKEATGSAAAPGSDPPRDPVERQPNPAMEGFFKRRLASKDDPIAVTAEPRQSDDAADELFERLFHPSDEDMVDERPSDPAEVPVAEVVPSDVPAEVPAAEVVPSGVPAEVPAAEVWPTDVPAEVPAAEVLPPDGPTPLAGELWEEHHEPFTLAGDGGFDWESDQLGTPIEDQAPLTEAWAKETWFHADDSAAVPFGAETDPIREANGSEPLDLVSAVERVAMEVSNGTLTVAQLAAITDLVRAVANSDHR